MKKILLSSAAIVAFAGAASAEVTFGGDVTLGYNDDIEDAFYADANLDITFTQELNNGWTAGATLEVEFDDLTQSTNNAASTAEPYDEDFTVYIESDMGGLYYGDYDSAADQLAIEVEGLEDGMFHYEDNKNLVIKGAFGGFEVAASTSIDNNTSGAETAAVKGSFGSVDFSLGYVAEEAAGFDAHGPQAKAVALAVGTTFGGADVKVGFADVGGDSRYGIEVGYPVGPVALTLWYSENDTLADSYGVKAVYEDGPLSVTAKVWDAGTTMYNLEGTYDLGNGLLIGAGTVDGEGEYLAAKYDLGGGATFLAAYADGDIDGTTTDIGDAYDGDFELKDGLTLEVSLSF